MYFYWDYNYARMKAIIEKKNMFFFIIEANNYS